MIDDLLSIAEQAAAFGVDLAIKAACLLLLALVIDAILRRWTLARTMLWDAWLVALIVLPIAAIWLPSTFDVSFSSEPKEAENASSLISSTAGGSPLAEPQWQSPPIATRDVSPTESGGPAASPSTPKLRVAPRRIALAGMIGAYVAVGFAMLVRLVVSIQSVRKLRKRSAPLENDVWSSRLAHWRDKLRIRRPIEVCVSGEVSTPLVVGISRPVVLLPIALAQGASQQQVDAVLVHELAHVQRGDFSSQLLLRCVQAVYWPIPLIWLAARLIAAARERACDEYCVWALGGQKQYAESLLQIAAATLVRSEHRIGLAMAARSRLAQRLKHLSRCHGQRRCTLPATARLACAAFLASAACVIGPAGADEPAAKPPVGIDQPAASDKEKKGAVDSLGDPLPSGAVARLGTSRWHMAMLYSMTGVAFSPKGDLVSWGDDSIRFWDASTGRQTGRFGPPDVRTTTGVAFASDGDSIVRAGEDGHLELWDLAKRERIWRIDAGTNYAPAVVYAPEAGLVACASNDKVRLWAAKDGAPRHSFDIGSPIGSLTFAPGGKALAAGDSGGNVHILQIEKDHSRTSFRAHRQDVLTLKFLDDGRKLLTSGRSRDASEIRLWNTETQEMLFEFGAVEELRAPCSCAISRDEKLLASFHIGTVAIRRLEGGELIRSIDAPGYSPNGIGGGIDISIDQKWVAIAGAEQRIRVWEIASGKEISTPGDSHLSTITAVRYSPDGRFIATGEMDSAVRLWDAATGRVLWRLIDKADGAGWVRSLAFLGEGKVLAIGSQVRRGGGRGEIRLVDIRSGELLHVAKTKEAITIVNAAPDGVNLAAAGRFLGGDDPFGGRPLTASPASVWKFDMTKLAKSRRLEFVGSELEGLEFLPDGSLVSLDDSGELRLWPPMPGDSKLIATIPGKIESFVLSRDGKTVLIGGGPVGDIAGKHVAAISLETGKTLIKMATGGRRPLGLAISPDGTLAAVYLLATELGDGSHHELVLWRLSGGKKVLTHIVDEGPGLFSPARLVDFSPDGRRVVLGTGRGDALIYDVAEAYGDR